MKKNTNLSIFLVLAVAIVGGFLINVGSADAAGCAKQDVLVTSFSANGWASEGQAVIKLRLLALPKLR